MFVAKVLKISMGIMRVIYYFLENLEVITPTLNATYEKILKKREKIMKMKQNKDKEDLALKIKKSMVSGYYLHNFNPKK